MKNDPYKALAKAWEELLNDIFKALRIPQIVKWLNDKLNDLKTK